MAEIKNPQKLFRVDIIESERGWGYKIDETKYFDSDEEAKNFVSDYNKRYNTSTVVPDWYMVAVYVGERK